MKYADIVDKLDGVLQYTFLDIWANSQLKEEFVQVSRDISPLERVCRKCMQDKYEHFQRLRTSLLILMEEGKTENKYTLELPEGFEHISFGGIVINKKNYTDSAAERIVALNPDFHKYFKGMGEAGAKKLSETKKPTAKKAAASKK
jgi:hypothetical protein